MKDIFCRCFWFWSFSSTWPGRCSNQDGKFVFLFLTSLEGRLLNYVEKLLGSQFFFCKPTCLVVPAKPLKQTLGAANPSQLLPRISMEQLVVESFFSNQLFSEANTTAGPTLPAFFFSFLLFFASLLLARLEVLFIPIAILRNS